MLRRASRGASTMVATPARKVAMRFRQADVVRRRYSVLGRLPLGLLAITALFSLSNAWWILAFRRGQPFDIDEAGYLAISITDFHALAEHGLLGWLATVDAPSIQAPLVTALSSLLYVVTGPHALVGLAVPIVAGAVTVVATYFLGEALGGRRVAVVSSLLVATTPAVLNYSRSYNFAIAGAAVATLAALALVRSERLTRLSWSLCFGVCLGLLPLARTMTLAFIPGLLIAAMVQAMSWNRKRRAITHLVISFGLAVAVAATWLYPNGSRVLAYLVDFGYGAQSAAYGQHQSLLSPDSWLLTIQYVESYAYLPDLVLLGVGALVLLAAVTRLLVQRPWLEVARTVARSPTVPPIFLVGEGLAALTSSGNKGSGFIVVLLPCMFVLASWAMLRGGRASLTRRIALGLALLVAATSVAAEVDLSSPLAEPRTVDLPVLGLATVADGRGTLQLYEAAGGYHTGNPAIPIAPAVGRAWNALSQETAAALFRSGGTEMLTAFGFRDRLYNVNSVGLEEDLSGRPALPLIQVDPSGLGDPLRNDYLWLTAGAAKSACLLVTVSGMRGQFAPAVAPVPMAAAARNAGFTIMRVWLTPDGQTARLWRRTRTCT